jgi:hypothetical protein
MVNKSKADNDMRPAPWGQHRGKVKPDLDAGKGIFGKSKLFFAVLHFFLAGPADFADSFKKSGLPQSCAIPMAVTIENPRK